MYQELGDGQWLSDKIENKEIFPVGGDMSGSINEYMKVDVDTFLLFFEKVAQNKEKVENDAAFKEWFKKNNIEFDYSLFCHMYTFGRLMQSVFPYATQHANKRAGFYEGKGKRHLSEGVSRGYSACNEFSVLAQLYFQTQGIPTRYVGGELALDGDFEAAIPHSFIVFQNNGKEYVYDPVNQLPNTLPRIAEFVGEKENYFLETKALLGKDKWYYAGGDKGAFLKNLPKISKLKKKLNRASKDSSVKKQHFQKEK